MNQKNLLTGLILFLSVNLVSAQYITKDGGFGPSGLSNQGKVTGYESQSGPYQIWLPDSGNVIISIGGVAPGNGVGGEARFSNDGNFISGTSMGANGTEASKYDRSTNTWTVMGSLGFPVQGDYSGGWDISGDANTLIGLAWTDTVSGNIHAHGIAINPAEGVMDLGSIYDTINRSTRANAVNYDGSVVVGWQDFNGPWKSAVWRKNPAGGYFPNQYILIDTTVSQFDEYNQIGQCSAVSDDGIWIGGYGDYANNDEPWIWSQDSGVINLGTLPNVGRGFVSDMNADGSIVVGWFDGLNFGDPRTPFIWTPTGGLQELNDYINNVLGLPTGTHQAYVASCISPDGHYIAGYGIDNSVPTLFAFRVSLPFSSSGIHEENKAADLNIYPNPTTGIVTIKNTGKADITISSMEGKVVYKAELNGTLVLDMSNYAPGVYSLMLQTADSVQTQKLVRN
jgi:hypothetical protein